jgi:hypothetical protein
MIRPALYRHPGDAANRETSAARGERSRYGDRDCYVGVPRPQMPQPQEGRITHNAEPLRGWRTRYRLLATSAKRLRQSVLCYQGIPLRSGMFAVDCSGRPPDMRIKAIIRTPVHPPPTNATTSHQTETILAPVSHGLANCQVFLPRPGCADLNLTLPQRPLVCCFSGPKDSHNTGTIST